MIAYCVFDTSGDIDSLVAIFSTEKKAVDFMESLSDTQYYYVSEWELMTDLIIPMTSSVE